MGLGQRTERANGLIVAIDGPSGAGKSTITRRLAERFSYVYIDTGAMYRTLALAVSRAGVSGDDDNRVIEICRGAKLSYSGANGLPRITLDNEDVADLIRTPEISLLTSKIASKKAVRELLLHKQREMGKEGGVILEGRDIGTVVFPDADVKFFLSASAEERGRRRYLELKAKGVPVDLENTVAEVLARDRQDESRDHAPLKQAEDAMAIDSTSLSIDEVVAVMAGVIEKRLAQALPSSCGGND
ncbi:cytidylate kinase [Geobacter sp. OR-1]|uniref:(d)CMP kinase n=1 Tax=Geobacter sp. OR-1 TaxID=1266765 RepID=UPI000541BDAA|nr:(d)CMP kinase [Geobacter sp. OR-1]GAM07983.1 cytidylate kinase [Geobacter sp. OR-1]